MRVEVSGMALCPFAQHKLIPPGPSDPAIQAIGVILHVDAGDAASLYDWFRSPKANGLESHFYVTKRLDPKRPGRTVIEQYRDTSREADANYKANSFIEGGVRKGYISVETQGKGEGEWTPEQLASIFELLEWLESEHGIPLQVCATPKSPGVGYHTMWGAPSEWTPVAKSCPGPDRIKQFRNVIVPWMSNRGASKNVVKKETRGWRVDQALADSQAVVQLLLEARKRAARPRRRKAITKAIRSIREGRRALKTLPTREK